jgi:hypothetical protein
MTLEKVQDAPRVDIAVTVLNMASKNSARRSPGWPGTFAGAQNVSDMIDILGKLSGVGDRELRISDETVDVDFRILDVFLRCMYLRNGSICYDMLSR